MATQSNDNWRARSGGEAGSGARSSTNTTRAPRGSGGGGRSRTSSTRKTDEPAAKEAVNTSSASERPKGPPRRGSRNVVPAVVVDPSTPTEAPSSAAARTPNRRKRSQQGHPRPPVSATFPTKGSFPPVPALKDTSRFGKNLRSDLPNPPMTAPLPRDNNVRSTIDAAVEHMRAVALGNDRPSTPGSHIDWAGDDDDESLPDLNDWGVSTPAARTPEPGPELELDSKLISPLIVEGLKPLPEPLGAKSATATPPTRLHIPTHNDVANTVIDRSPSRSREASPVRIRSRNASPQPSPSHSPVLLPPKPAFLPERPTAAAQTAEMPARSSKATASPMRSPVSPVRARSRSPAPSPASSPQESSFHKIDHHHHPKELKEVDNHLAPPGIDDNNL